jgi:hypothetical protein
MKKEWCKTCKHCRPAPDHESYEGTIGWCMCPQPFWNQAHPLIATAYAKSVKKCDTYAEGEYKEEA